MNLKRDKIRKALIKKLFNYYLNIFDLSGQVNFRFTFKYCKASMEYFLDSGKVAKNTILYNHLQVQRLFKNKGFDNVYYNGRKDKIEKIITSQKLMTRFVILHELFHAILSSKLIRQSSSAWSGTKDYERQADNFALGYLMV